MSSPTNNAETIIDADSQLQSPYQVHLDELLTLSDRPSSQNDSFNPSSSSDIVAELAAQCPPGKESEFRKLIEQIVVVGGGGSGFSNEEQENNETEAEGKEVVERNEADQTDEVEGAEEAEETKEAEEAEENAMTEETKEAATTDKTDEAKEADNSEKIQSEATDSEIVQVDAGAVDESNSNKKAKTDEQEGPAAPAELTDYVREFYPIGGKLVSYSPTRIRLEAHKQNDSNYWGVSWQSEWEVSGEETGGEEIITGRVRVRAHYYEDGNVQLDAHRTFSSSRSRSRSSNNTSSNTKPSIKQFIQQSEDTLQMSLNEAYQQLADVSFKRLRRQLPITRQKMDWGKFANYKLSSELKESK